MPNMNDETGALVKNNEAAIKNLFKQSQGVETDIHTYDNPLKGKWCVYRRLGLIAPRFPAPLLTNYAVSQSDSRGGKLKIIKRKAARLGFLNSLGLLAAKSMDISGIDLPAGKIMFWRRDRSIRLFDFSEHTSIYMASDQVFRDKAENHVNFRKKHRYDFLLQVLEHGEDWYKEPIIYGKKLAAYKNRKIYPAMLKNSINCLQQLADDTVTYMEAADYINQLGKKIELNTQALPPGSFAPAALNQVMAKLSGKALQLDKPVPVVLAHCDLHPQNIMLDKNRKIFIIDWETNSRRSVWYDPACLLLDIRRPPGMLKLISNCQKQDVIAKLLCNDRQKSYRMDSVVSILALELILGRTIIIKDKRKDAGTIINNFIEYISNSDWYKKLC